MNSAFFYNLCVTGYVLALFIYIFNIATNKAAFRKVATTIVALSFLSETAGMVFRWAEAGFVELEAFEKATGQHLEGLSWFLVFTQHPPWSNLYEILVFMSWGIIFVFLISEVKWQTKFLGIFSLTLALIVLGMASLSNGIIKPLVPALKSWWIMIHVISASIAYAAGTMGAVASLLYLIKAKTRVRLILVAACTMFTSSALIFVLGGGFSLLKNADYKVRLYKEMGGDLIQVVRQFDGDFKSFYVSSPGVGMVSIFALIFCFLAGFILFKNRRSYEEPNRWHKACYFLGVFLTVLIGVLIVYNNLTLKNVQVSPSIASELMPPGPWRLSMSSNTWDLGFLGVILTGQIFVGVAVLWPRKIRELLPSPAKLDQIAYSNIVVSFILVALVLVTGALWAHYAWGRYWGWDPKETGALVIWLTYALYLHTRLTYGWVGPRSAVIGIFGFFVIIAGFLGVNLGWFADGLHSYGSS